MFKFFIENDLILPNQSGLKPRDSCINQLLSITHDIYKSFDSGYEVRGDFLDVSKALDKVWHDPIIFKLEQNCISGKLHKLLHDFLVNRKQMVVLNGPNDLNDDLVKINNWSYQWKMSFNPDPNKQAQEVIFRKKTKKINHPPLTFSNFKSDYISKTSWCYS